MYADTLLGGGKNYSIQSILEQNYKIITSYAGASLIQAKHTNNYFEFLQKNLNLPDMTHLGVVVTSLPAPIINLPGASTPRGAPKQTDNEKEFDEMEIGVLKDYGLDKLRQNALPTVASNERDYGTTLLDGLSTDVAGAKFTPARSFRSEYKSIKEAELKNGYADSFTSDLVQFEAFTKAIVDHL